MQTKKQTAPAKGAAKTLATTATKSAARPAAKPATKAATKAATKPAAKPAVKPAAKSAKPVAKAAKPAKPAKRNPPAAAPDAAKPKTKLVRDSFTIPKSEYAVLEGLKARSIALKQPAKKSELLRAGVAALHALGDRAFLAALAVVPNLKTGRPKSVAK